MRVVYWIFAGLLAALAGLFALANRADVTIDFWPVGPSFAMPVFVALVGALYLGFALGALVAWLAQGRTRRRAREAVRRAAALERELAQVRGAAVAPAAPSAPPAPALPPAPPI
ncbi:MAG: LapA family protein [Rhodospirillales bacterium]|nr:LapA family protein [Rhodospirillales bacterium]